MPQLANVFYYGKDFGTKKKEVGKAPKYKALSVTKAGALGEQIEEAEAAKQEEGLQAHQRAMQNLAQMQETKENDINGLLDQILGTSTDTVSFDDLLNIVKGS